MARCPSPKHGTRSPQRPRPKRPAGNAVALGVNGHVPAALSATHRHLRRTAAPTGRAGADSALLFRAAPSTVQNRIRETFGQPPRAVPIAAVGWGALPAKRRRARHARPGRTGSRPDVARSRTPPGACAWTPRAAPRSWPRGRRTRPRCVRVASPPPGHEALPVVPPFPALAMRAHRPEDRCLLTPNRPHAFDPLSLENPVIVVLVGEWRRSLEHPPRPGGVGDVPSERRKRGPWRILSRCPGGPRGRRPGLRLPPTLPAGGRTRRRPQPSFAQNPPGRHVALPRRYPIDPTSARTNVAVAIEGPARGRCLANTASAGPGDREPARPPAPLTTRVRAEDRVHPRAACAARMPSVPPALPSALRARMSATFRQTPRNPISPLRPTVSASMNASPSRRKCRTVSASGSTAMPAVGAKLRPKVHVCRACSRTGPPSRGPAPRSRCAPSRGPAVPCGCTWRPARGPCVGRTVRWMPIRDRAPPGVGSECPGSTRSSGACGSATGARAGPPPGVRAACRRPASRRGPRGRSADPRPSRPHPLGARR